MRLGDDGDHDHDHVSALQKQMASTRPINRAPHAGIAPSCPAPLRIGAAVAAHFFVRSIFVSEKSPTPAAVRAATRTSYSESWCKPLTVYGWLGAVNITQSHWLAFHHRYINNELYSYHYNHMTCSTIRTNSWLPLK